MLTYLGAEKSLARPPSRCILFDGENIFFVASLVIRVYTYTYIYVYNKTIYIYSTNIPRIMVINRIYIGIYITILYIYIVLIFLQL